MAVETTCSEANNNTDLVEDFVDVVEETDDQQQRELSKIEEPIIHQERRLEDVRRVRDEAESLRKEICQLRIRLESVEEESKFHAAKANELTELLMNVNSSSGNSGIDSTILRQSEELARKFCQIGTLEKKITKLKTEKSMMEIERDNAKKDTAKLSSVVRSLQTYSESGSHMDDDNDDDDEDGDDSEESEEVVLTPETALDLTLGNLKEHIEMLEDGLQASSTLNSDLQKAGKIKEYKISILEQLFYEMNADGRDVYDDLVKKFEKSNSSNDDSKKCEKNENNPIKKKTFKTNDKSKKQDEKGSRSATSVATTAAKDLVERFHTIGMNALTGISISIPTVGRYPDIPVEAAAAAQAAAILVGTQEQQQKQKTDNSKSETPSTPKEKRTIMKKVKIKFKKAGLEGTYTGPLVDKKPHGVGTIRFSNGDTYLGEMQRGKMSGTGTLYSKAKGVLRGQFQKNQFVGALEPAAEGSTPETSKNGMDSISKTGASISKEPSSVATATTTTTEDDSDVEAKANTMAALELDGFSATAITGSQDILEGMDDVMSDLEMSIRRKNVKEEEHDSFVKEFSGSETSGSFRSSPVEDDGSSIEEPPVF